MNRILAWKSHGDDCREASLDATRSIVIESQGEGTYYATLRDAHGCVEFRCWFDAADWTEALASGPATLAESIMEDAEQLRDLIREGATNA